MRRFPLVLLGLVACGPTSADYPKRPQLDEATVKTQSRAFVDAYDRGDSKALLGTMAPAFVWFKEARMADRDSFAGLVRDLAHAPRRTRHWVEEHVYLGEDSAVFIGESLEQQPAEDGGKPLTRDGWSTVVWVRDHGAWKVAHYQWQKGGIDVERDVWNDQFRTGAGFNHKPNQLLVDAVKGRTPGRALDLASGQGRNALYLATQGWTVTAVDISDVGLKITGDSAAAANVK
ncbi:MAG TPA: DUF4440 domain-containing protein, partial [Polyangiales bacterium]